MKREELINSKEYKVSKAAIEWFQNHQEADALDGFEAGYFKAREGLLKVSKDNYMQGFEDGSCDSLDKEADIAMTTIDKAYNWLKENAKSYVYWMDEEFGEEDLVKDFRKYMEDNI